WRGVHVEDGALRVHMAAIRKVFGADRELLQTSVGRGYRLLGKWDVRQADGPPSAAASSTMQPATIPRSVPAAAADLFGRSPAIARLRQLLSAYRTVTLVGPGGIGKTTLALEVARLAAPDLAAESAAVELAALSDPALVPSAVASVLGVKLEGVEDTTAAIARTIGNRQVLLVVDNCEHVIDAAARLAEAIINRCPRVTVLATSREALRIRGEHVSSVPPLSVPPQTIASRDEALEHSSVQLFIARAHAHGSYFAQNEDNIAAVATICRRLDGIPLAIELAAARSVMLAPPKINALLDDRFRLLTKGWRTA